MSKRTNVVLCGIVFIFAFLVTMIFADTNGIWHRAEDVQGGIFGSDENVQNYTFDVLVYFLNSVLREGVYYIDINGTSNINNLNTTKMITNGAYIYTDLNVTGNIIQNGSLVATVNSSGKIPLNQLPFS